MAETKFNISVLSKIVGIAPETVRHYERKGIGKPLIQENKYRKYELHDLCILARARAYREYGFSLEEAREMMETMNIDYTLNNLEKRAENLENQIYKEISVLESIKKKVSEIKESYRDLGKISIRNRPAMYAVHTFHNGVPMVDSIEAGKAAKWYGKQTITFPIWEFSCDQFEKGDIKDYDVHMAVMADETRSPEVPISESVIRYFPSCTCLHTITLSDIADGWTEAFKPIFEYMRTRGMHATGPILWQTVTGHASENVFMYCRNLYIPIL